MNRQRIHIALTAAAIAAALISCGGAKTASTRGGPQDGDQGNTQEQPRQARAARQQYSEPAAAGPTIDELREMRMLLMGLNVPVGMAMAEASSESDARAVALDSARTDLIRWTAVQTHRFGETYARNVPEAARNRWEERVALMADGATRNAPVFKSAVEHDRANRIFRVYVLTVYDPVMYKQALGDAMTGNDEFNRRAQKDDLRKKMDAIILDFNSKYRR